MEVTINTLSGVEQEAEINVPDAELQPVFEQAYQKYRQKVELRGFRKGKAPMEMVKKLYGEAIEHESLDTVADEFYRRAMTEKNILPIGRPSMTDMEFKRGERFRFKIKYEIKPSIELKQYKGIAVEKPIHVITDAEINAEIDHLRRINSTTTEVSTVTDVEHIVTGDVQELDETGSPLVGKKTANARFYLSDQTLAKEIRESLSHAEPNGTYRTTVTSTQDNETRSTHIAITVTKIEKVNLPTFDDTFIQKITSEKVATTGEFLKNLRTDLEKYWEEKADRAVSDAIAAEIIRVHEVQTPETLVNGFLDAFVEDIKSKSKDRKLPHNFDEKKFREESRSYAIWQAKWMLLKERIAGAEQLTVTDEEIESLAAHEATRIGIEKERLLEYYRKSSAAVDRLLSDKIVTFLKQNAIIREKEIKEEPSH